MLCSKYSCISHHDNTRTRGCISWSHGRCICWSCRYVFWNGTSLRNCQSCCTYLHTLFVFCFLHSLCFHFERQKKHTNFSLSFCRYVDSRTMYWDNFALSLFDFEIPTRKPDDLCFLLQLKRLLLLHHHRPRPRYCKSQKYCSPRVQTFRMSSLPWITNDFVKF